MSLNQFVSRRDAASLHPQRVVLTNSHDRVDTHQYAKRELQVLERCWQQQVFLAQRKHERNDTARFLFHAASDISHTWQGRRYSARICEASMTPGQIVRNRRSSDTIPLEVHAPVTSFGSLSQAGAVCRGISESQKQSHLGRGHIQICRGDAVRRS